MSEFVKNSCDILGHPTTRSMLLRFLLVSVLMRCDFCYLSSQILLLRSTNISAVYDHFDLYLKSIDLRSKNRDCGCFFSVLEFLQCTSTEIMQILKFYCHENSCFFISLSFFAKYIDFDIEMDKSCLQPIVTENF